MAEASSASSSCWLLGAAHTLGCPLAACEVLGCSVTRLMACHFQHPKLRSCRRVSHAEHKVMG